MGTQEKMVVGPLSMSWKRRKVGISLKRARRNGVASDFSVFFRFFRFHFSPFCWFRFFAFFFRFLPFFPFSSVSYSEKKRGDTVRETPFAKPRKKAPTPHTFSLCTISSLPRPPTASLQDPSLSYLPPKTALLKPKSGP